MTNCEDEVEKLFKMMDSFATAEYLYSEENGERPNYSYYRKKLSEALKKAEECGRAEANNFYGYDKGLEDGLLKAAEIAEKYECTKQAQWILPKIAQTIREEAT